MGKLWVFTFITILVAIFHHSYSQDNGYNNVNQRSANKNKEQNSRGVPRRYKHDEQLTDYNYNNHVSPPQYLADNYNEHRSPPQQEKVWRFDLDLPEVLRTIKSITGVSISDAKQKPQNRYDTLRARDDGILSQKIRVEMRPPNIAAILGYLNSLVNVQPATRRRDPALYGYTEQGPGIIKAPNVTYPAGWEAGILKNLMRLKRLKDQKSVSN